MTLFGTQVRSRESQAASAATIDTGTAFFTGLSERGPADQATLCHNLEQVQSAIGARSGGQMLYDAADVFFREGGSRLYLSRVVGPNPTVATANIPDAVDTNTLRADAASPGAWGADVDLIISDGDNPGEFIISVEDDGEEVANSGVLTTKQEAILWAANTDYVRLTDLGSGGIPDAGTISLVGGSDDRNNVTEDTWGDALANFRKDYGPGQVAAPGHTTTAGHEALLQHAEDNNRFALIDFVDTAVIGTLTAAAGDLRLNGRYGAGFAPWGVCPGVSLGTTRTVPWSAFQAGMIARLEAQGVSPGTVAAGGNGRSQYAVDLSQPVWTDGERETLDDAGVNPVLSLYGAIQTYGDRTLVNTLSDPAFFQIGSARVYMAIAADADEIASRYVFAKIDGKGKKLSEFQGELAGMLVEYYDDDDLYGATFQDAAKVDVGAQVNTAESLSAGRLSALIAVRISPTAEVVLIEITKVANTEVLV